MLTFFEQAMHPKATSFETAHAPDHPLEMAPRTDPDLDHRHLEDPKMIAVLVVRTLGLGMMGDKLMVRQPLAGTRRRWIWTSRRMQTKKNWKK